MVLFNCHNWNGQAEAKQAKLESYWVVLSELSPDEIIAVCQAAMRGQIGNPAFLPAVSELYQAARPSPRNAPKKSPDWRPHQDRLLSSSGTLYITADGGTEVYSAGELREWGYALPPPPEVLNRPELEARGIESLHRLTGPKQGEPEFEGGEPTEWGRKALELIKGGLTP